MEDGIFPHGRSIGMASSNSELEEERRLMYVGITRAKEKLFLTHAKQRKVWGNYQSNPKSRFLDEIPSSLIEEDSTRATSSTKSSFSSTISKIKEKKNSPYSSSSSSSSYSSSTSAPTNNFASSLARIKQSANKAKEIQNTPTTNYKTINAKVVKKSEPKKEQQQKLNIQSMILKAKQKAQTPTLSQSNRQLGLLPVGTRVFHSSFGVGTIKEATTTSYVVDFTKSGEKTLDTTTSGLKTF